MKKSTIIIIIVIIITCVIADFCFAKANSKGLQVEDEKNILNEEE